MSFSPSPLPPDVGCLVPMELTVWHHCAGILGCELCRSSFHSEGYIDLSLARSETVIRIARCWGALSADFILAKDDAARAAIQRMRSELDLHIIDTNYDNFMLYKSLYDYVTAQHTKLLGQFENLKRQYNLLKDCYASAVAERVEYIDEKVKMCRTIDECHVTIDRLRADRPVAASDRSEEGSAS
uniref:Uncharacterized protein n=1 Tax=Ananas comosus var. bracteatus TaxID=296719 RepID=A0A6V7NSJ7_ANACO|nr:unnamed protein product [Ananas comosus var. bracteatus]